MLTTRFLLQVRLSQSLVSDLPIRVPLDLTSPGPTGQVADVFHPRLYHLIEGIRHEQPVQFIPAVDFHATNHPRGELCWIVRGAEAHRDVLSFELEIDWHTPQGNTPPYLGPQGAEGHPPRPRFFPRVQLFRRPGHAMEIQIREKPVLTYRHDPGEPKPYLYPVIGPAGRELTRLGHPDDPMMTHDHHHSIWVGHGDVGGINFWEEQPGSGIIRHQHFALYQDGPVVGTLCGVNLWQTADGDPILREHRWLFVYDTDDPRILDVTLELTPAAKREVVLGVNNFGLFAVRVVKWLSVWYGDGRMTNSEGGINEPGCFGQHAAWLDYSGPVAEGLWNGIATLDHPENPGHPTAWHCRNDGWYGTSLTRTEPYVLNPGEVLRLRYRLILHHGSAEVAHLGRQWHYFAHPPQIEMDTLE